jgi:hypothetical protein
MRVLLVTTWNERCGIAEYAANLVRHCKCEFEIVDPVTFMNFGKDVSSFDLVHVNHEPGLYPGMTQYHVQRFCDSKPAMITLHATQAGYNHGAYIEAFQKIVVHEQTQDVARWPSKWIYIPEGIPVAVSLAPTVENTLGTCGFPFPWKGWDEVAYAAKFLNLGMIACLPESKHADALAAKRQIESVLGAKAYIVTEYLPESGVIHHLSRNLVNVFPYKGHNAGISGAVRMGLAARRPVVVSASRQFNDLFMYREELYVSPQSEGQELYDCIQNAVLDARSGHARLPNQVIKDMGWERSARAYMDVYNSIAR